MRSLKKMLFGSAFVPPPLSGHVFSVDDPSSPLLRRVAALHQSCFQPAWEESFFRHILSCGHGKLLVGGLSEGSLDGFIAATAPFETAEILSFCIRPQVRRQGLGRALMKALLEDLRCRQIQEVFLEVRPSNHAALKLYAQENFVLFGRRPRYYPPEEGGEAEDALCLRRDL